MAISTDAQRRAIAALNPVFNAEQVNAFVVACEHLMDGYVRQITAPPLPPESTNEVVGEATAEAVAKASTTRKAK